MPSMMDRSDSDCRKEPDVLSSSSSPARSPSGVAAPAATSSSSSSSSSWDRGVTSTASTWKMRLPRKGSRAAGIIGSLAKKVGSKKWPSWLQEELLSAERLDSEDGGSGGSVGCGSSSSTTDPDGERPQSEGKSSPSAGASRLREQEGDEAQLSPSA
ncbi:hypothetical protein LEMLEM_LOCUS25401, partial [Lemmus lemmus]